LSLGSEGKMTGRVVRWKPLLLAFFAGAAVVFVVGAILVLRAELRARRAFHACQGNLLEIENALYTYAFRHNEFLPSSLDVLVEEALISKEDLYCPVSGRKYLYGFEGRELTRRQLPRFHPLVVERGFPHAYPFQTGSTEGTQLKLFSVVGLRGNWISAEDLCARLQAGEQARVWAAEGATEAALAQEMSLLTVKKRVYVANVGEEDLPGGGPLSEEVARVAEEEGAPSVVLCAQLEADLGDWPPDEAAAYRADVGLDRSGLEALAQAGYAVLGLITFFTITGGKNTRAWPIQRGTRASQAAGEVHSQMEHGFIRAEVVHFERLAELGSWVAARERGILRVEGRDYEVQDGDVCLFRFNP